MNKSDLANHVAKRLHISHSDSLRYLNTLIEEVEAILAGNEYLTIQNFGTFSPWHQAARPGEPEKRNEPCDTGTYQREIQTRKKNA